MERDKLLRLAWQQLGTQNLVFIGLEAIASRLEASLD